MAGKKSIRQRGVLDGDATPISRKKACTGKHGSAALQKTMSTWIDLSLHISATLPLRAA
jgi:hypothetical protein